MAWGMPWSTGDSKIKGQIGNVSKYSSKTKICEKPFHHKEYILKHPSLFFQIVFLSTSHEEWLVCKSSDMLILEINYIVHFSVFQ